MFSTLAVIIVGVAAFFFVGAAASIAITVAGSFAYAGLRPSVTRPIAPFVSFAVALSLYLAWAVLCWGAADWLAGQQFGNRWVLLFFAAGLAGAPYHWALRSAESSWRNGLKPDPAFGSALSFAGGLQSKAVIAMMISGYWFDWWPHLPG